MTAEKQRGYRFSTEAQWGTCIAARTDADSLRTTGAIRPLLPYAHAGTLQHAPGAHVPAVTRAGEILWADGRGTLYHMMPGDDQPFNSPAPPAITRATRIVATASGLWALSDALSSYDEESLTRQFTVELPARVVDIASAGGDSLYALVEERGQWKAIRVSRSGHVCETIVFKGISHAKAFVFLQRSRRFVVLHGERHEHLTWFSMGDEKPLLSVNLALLRPCFATVPVSHPCFVGVALGSDSRDRVLLAGADGKAFGGSTHVLVLDADGNLVGDVLIDAQDTPVTGVVATRDSLLATGPRGMLRFAVTDVVPEGAGHVSSTVITPMLFAPDREDGRRWLRVDASATLPEGSSIEISYAATDDIETRDRLKVMATNASVSASQRVDRMLAEPDLWRGRTVFHGATGSNGRVYSAKLFDVREQYLWVSVTLSAAAGAHLPQLSELNVRYPGLTLMEKLPAIYQRDEAQPDSFLRGLVGVLETTTKGIDARIASLGSHIHPSTAPELWLDFLARWLGVPWDDALSERQKRAIVTRAAELAKGRGTRAALEALLECLLPGTPRRFRVTDATADAGFAIVGGASCTGSALPAMLGGRTRWSSELDVRAVLGYTRLPCPSQLDDGAWQLAGRIRVEVAATSAERQAWEPWFRALVEEMIPVTARLELRWVSPDALRSDRLDGTLTLKSAPLPHLGIDAVTDLARLPERGTRLSASGSNISTRLR